MPIISITNQKGGVGKTTMLASLATLLTQAGYKVLCIDLDPQRNLDMMAGREFVINPNDTETPSLLHVLNRQIPIQDAIVHTELGDLVRASSLLPSWAGEPVISESEFHDLEQSPEAVCNFLRKRFQQIRDNPTTHVLRHHLKDLKAQYDYIFLVTNPSLMLLTMNALYAADYVLIPVFPDDFSKAAINDLWDTIQNIVYYESFSSEGHRLRVAGMVVTKSDKRTRVSREYYKFFEKKAEKMDSILFKTEIRRSVIASEATAAGQSIVSYAYPGEGIVQDYKALMKEFIDRINYLEENRGE